MIVDRLSSTLEHSLGPGIISEVDKVDDSKFKYQLGWRVVFRPRDFIFKQKKAKAKIGTQDDEGSGLLSQAGIS